MLALLEKFQGLARFNLRDVGPVVAQGLGQAGHGVEVHAVAVAWEDKLGAQGIDELD